MNEPISWDPSLVKKFSSSKKYEVEVNLVEKYNAFSKTFLPTSNINDISF